MGQDEIRRTLLDEILFVVDNANVLFREILNGLVSDLPKLFSHLTDQT